MSSRQGAGKRPHYEDLDAPDAVDPVNCVRGESHTGSNPSSSSGGKKKKKNISGHEKDEGYPPLEYTHFIREVTVNYYRLRQVRMLKTEYLDHGQAGILKLQADLEREFWSALQGSELYMDCMTKYFHSPKWLAQQVSSATTNVVHVFESYAKKPQGDEWGEEDKLFLEKLKMVQDTCKQFSTGKTKVMPWNEQALKAAMERHMHGGVVWIPNVAKVVPLSGFNAQGGYGKVRKVRIANMPGIPIHIEFAGKLSKAKSEREKREQRSCEALVCPVQHPGVIKFWAIHSESMEAYTLWWNGDCLRNFIRNCNDKVSEASSYKEILKLKNLPMEECQRIVAYRKNRGMLAWSLIYVMDLVHKAKILHNDLTPSNILLHFPAHDKDKAYIGVCDWGMASRIIENKASFYGFREQDDLQRCKAQKPGVAPELFFLYGNSDDEERNLERMKRMHPCTTQSDAFSVGYLAKKIWKDEECPELFRDVTSMIAFSTKLNGLLNEDPAVRLSLARVVEDLMSPPYNFKAPTSCFRYTL
jgi:hypothetical protein